MINMALDFDEQLQKKYGEDYLWEDHKEEIFPDNDRKGEDIAVSTQEPGLQTSSDRLLRSRSSEMESASEHGQSGDQQG
jgi:hypothetical protein